MKKYSIVFILLLSLASCKNFLDIKPHEEVIPETAEEFSALLHSHLDDLDRGNLDCLIESTQKVTLYEQVADNLEVALTDKSTGQALKIYPGDIYTMSINKTNYSSLYEIIRDCNIIFGEMKGDKESDLAKNVLGTAYAMRGACYYELLRRFCEVYDPNKSDQLGLQIVTTFDMENWPVRSSLKKTIDFIEDDLKKALSYNVQDDIYRFTAPVVKGYLSRFYFWTRQWDKAADFATQVMAAYPLLDRDGYKEMMTPAYSLKGNMLIKSETISSSTTESEGVGTYEPIKARPVSKRFIDTFSDEEKANDIRYEMNFTVKRITKKFIFSGMRSAEMLLIRAESYYHMGEQGLALDDINTLRSNRIKDYVPLTMDQLPEPVEGTDLITVDVTGASLTRLMSLILTERRKELFMEGDRFFELKRNGSPEFWVPEQGQKFVTRKFMYTYPIPLTDVDIVPGLQQNEGYDEFIIR